MGFNEAIKAEFINLADTDIKTIKKKCDIKVFYLFVNITLMCDKSLLIFYRYISLIIYKHY